MNRRDTINTFLNLQVGEWFRDHRGVIIEKVSDTEVFVGPGYNNVLTIEEYILSVRRKER